MSLAPSIQNTHHQLRSKRCYVTLTPTGNYPGPGAGGDVVNFYNATITVGQSLADVPAYPGSVSDWQVISSPPGYSALLVKGTSLTNWGLQVFEQGAEQPAGVPLTLGTLSAAATQSTFTSNGVLTVVGANTLSAGNFVVLSNGTSGAGICFNGQLGQVVSATASQYVINFGALKSFNYTIATDTLKYQVVQASSTNLLQLGTTSIAVSAVAVASNVLTITCTNTGTAIQPGMFIVLQGLAAGEVPQGAIVQVLTASTTSITANIIAANLSATSGETATATVLVTNGNAPIGAITNTITGSTVAATATTSSAAGKITVLPVANNFVTGSLFMVQGLSHGSALNGGIFSTLATGLTASNVAANGYVASAVTTGTADLGVALQLATGQPASATGELASGPYPAGILGQSFVVMIEGPKAKL